MHKFYQYIVDPKHHSKTPTPFTVRSTTNINNTSTH